MGENLAGKIFAKLAIAVFVFALVDLAYVNWLVIGNKIGGETKIIETRIEEVPSGIVGKFEVTPSATASASPASNDKEVIKTTETIVEKETQVVVQTAQKEVFIPIGSGSSNSNAWTDVAGLEVSVDSNLYGTIESANFETTLSVVGGNGKAYARLNNSTDGRQVWSSEVSTSSATAVLLKSAGMALDSGAKAYRVQAKTDLTDYAATVANARIKLVLK